MFVLFYKRLAEITSLQDVKSVPIIFTYVLASSGVKIHTYYVWCEMEIL